jgi:hypothetical protein
LPLVCPQNDPKDSDRVAWDTQALTKFHQALTKQSQVFTRTAPPEGLSYTRPILNEVGETPRELIVDERRTRTNTEENPGHPE